MFRRLLDRSVVELFGDIERDAPALGSGLRRWAAALPGTGQAADLFTSRWRYPFLLLPWWAEQSARGNVDLEFQQALVRSGVAGYYYIRLVDDVMDRHGGSPALLPVTGPLFSAAQSPYAAYFPPDHVFWTFFRSALLEGAEGVFRETTLDQGDIDEATFRDIAARKTAAAKIPLSAVLLRYGLPDLHEPWHRVCDVLGRHEQLLDDLVDSLHDLASGQRTWLLAEACRRGGGEDGAVAWLLDQGVGWVFERLRRWRHELDQLARSLRCAGLSSFLAERTRDLDRWYASNRPALVGLGRVGHLMTSQAP